MGLCTVLVIDDEPMIRDVIQQALGRADFVVETAGDAHAGMEKFDNGNYDLVITDVQMPSGGGYTVVHHIRSSSRSHIPVIGISGTPWLLKENHFDRVMSKPFQISHIIDTAKALTASCENIGRKAAG